MDLTRMDRAALAQLQRDLARVQTAADALAADGCEPEITLGAAETVLRAPSILCFGAEPEPVLVEKTEIDIEPAVPAPTPPGGAAVPAGGKSSQAGPAGRQTTAKDLVTGPLSERERAEIIRRHADGAIAADIAAALHRKPQVVALFLLAQERKAESLALRVPRMNQKAGQPAPEPGQAATDKIGTGRTPATAEGMADPAAPGAGGAAGIEDGMSAEIARAVAAGAVASRAAIAPAEVPDDLHGEARLIWRALVALRQAPGWDIETDLEICEAFGRGTKVAHLALELGIDAVAITQRYKALTAVIRDDRGHMSIEGQTLFITLLRRRVAELRTGSRRVA
jgi:hypothetical protein